MKARANISSRLPRRRAAGIAHERAAVCDRDEAVEIFKKTPSIAGSQLAGRDVAKDLFEIDGIPFLAKTGLADGEFAERRRSCEPREIKCGSGAIRDYARQVGPAVNGAIIHWDGAREKQRYAHI